MSRPLSRRTAMAAMIAGVPAFAGAASPRPWTRELASGRGQLLRCGSDQSPRALVFFPGANCAAYRYRWLGALQSSRLTVYLFQPLATPASSPLPGQTFPKIADVLAVLQVVGPRHPILLGGGHSAGAAALLDALDPVSALASPRDHFTAGYEPPQDVAGAFVLGCSLQAHVLDMVMAYRSEDRPLTRPHNAPLLFLAGDHDLIAPPALMDKTRSRFAPPTQFEVLPSAAHYGWADGRAETDKTAFNAPGAVSPREQQAMTVARLSSWIAALSP